MIWETWSIRPTLHRPSSRYAGSKNHTVNEPSDDKIIQVYLYVRIVLS